MKGGLFLHFALWGFEWYEWMVYWPAGRPCSHEWTVEPSEDGLCSLGLVEAGFSRRRLQQLGGLADRHAKHGAVGHVAEDAAVATLGRHLWRRGRRQRADLVDRTPARLLVETRRQTTGGEMKSKASMSSHMLILKHEH